MKSSRPRKSKGDAPPDCATLCANQAAANKALIALKDALVTAQDQYNAQLQISIAADKAVADAGCQCG